MSNFATQYPTNTPATAPRTRTADPNPNYTGGREFELIAPEQDLGNGMKARLVSAASRRLEHVQIHYAELKENQGQAPRVYLWGRLNGNRLVGINVRAQSMLALAQSLRWGQLATIDGNWREGAPKMDPATGRVTRDRFFEATAVYQGPMGPITATSQTVQVTTPPRNFIPVQAVPAGTPSYVPTMNPYAQAPAAPMTPPVVAPTPADFAQVNGPDNTAPPATGDAPF